MKIFTLKMLFMSVLLCVGLSARGEKKIGTITFGTNNVKINGASVTGADSQSNTWTITTEGTTSFTQQPTYSQVGSSSKPATSITFTTTLPASVNITAFSANFSGFNNTAGTITLKVGNSTVGTGSLNGTSDVTVSSTSPATGNVLTVTVTNIAKGVACYNISYTYEEGGSVNPAVATTTTINASGITNTNVFNGTAAGSLSATVTAGSTAVEGATVTWSSSNTGVATVASNGAVTLVGAGTTTITASYAGVTDEYQASSATYELTVTNVDPNAPGATAENPYTVAQAISNTPSTGSSDEVYIKGIVSEFYASSITSDGNNYRYYISDDGSTTNQLLVYKGKGLNNVAFSNANDLLVGDEVVIKGKLTTYSNAPEVAADNYIVSRVTPPVIKPYTNQITLSYDITEAELSYEIINPIEGKVLTATLEEGITWISNIQVYGDKITYNTTVNEGTEDRTATITLQYERAVSVVITVTQQKPDYATLPFYWAGGGKEALTALQGVYASGLGNDYGAQNAPYNVKFDNTGDYIEIKTNSPIKHVAVDVKMIGGSTTSKITVQGAVNVNDDFVDVEELTISGKQNDVLNLATTAAFDASYRYVRLVFTKGSNVGVGPIAINTQVKKTISEAGYATFCSPYALDFTDTGLTAYVATVNGDNVSFTEVDKVPANTGVLLKGAAGEYDIPAVGGVDAINDNALVGVTEETVFETPGIFVLLNEEPDGVGFYKTESTFTVGANTAYIPASVVNVKDRFIAIENDDATAITAIEAADAIQNGVIYNLSGQRVVKPLKGIYIQNGKKILVK